MHVRGQTDPIVPSLASLPSVAVPVPPSVLTTAPVVRKPSAVNPSRVLFLVKKRDGYGSYGSGFSSGLWNSARFASDMLNAEGIPAQLVEVVDNNDIDREVSAFKPSHVIIEALWVVPDKFAVLSSLHPTVRWIIRFHSEIPFLAQECIALDWLKQYLALPNVYVAHNTRRGVADFQQIAVSSGALAGRILYLPTYYPIPTAPANPIVSGKTLNAICPGAVRPFKNHINQALGAMAYATGHGRVLNFHVNAGRVETGGEAVLRNLRSLFAGTKHNLIEIPWVEHAEFLKVIHTMDLGMQVSFTETFDICAADIVSAGVPLVTSRQVSWAGSKSQCDPNDVRSITNGIREVFHYNTRDHRENVRGLTAQAQAGRASRLKAIGSL